MRLTDGYIFSLEGIEVYKNWVFTFFILKWIYEKSLERVGPSLRFSSPSPSADASLSLNGLAALSDEDFCDRIFEFAKIITMRTKLLEKYADVIDDVLEWDELARPLVRRRDGAPAAVALEST